MERKKEIIFNMSDYNGNSYRVVCRFGYHSFINMSWWGYIQKKTTHKKWTLFGPIVEKWIEIDRCWWSKEIVDRESLERSAINFYDERILLPDRMVERAMNI
jgi:hypothetical protein